MQFNFHQKKPTEREQLLEFDKFLTTLSEHYPEEFKNPIYSRMTFLGLGWNGTPHFHEHVPQEIRNKITDKLTELFYA